MITTDTTPSSATSFAGLLREGTSTAPPECSDDAYALYQYSSGSTGRQKRVGRTNRQCLSEGGLVATTLGLGADDTILCTVPLFHAYGFGDCFLAALCSGARLLVQPHVQPFAMRRAQTLTLIAEERVTVFPAVPYMIDLLVAAPGHGDLTSLRYCFSAGTALPEELAAAFLDRYRVPVRQLYGCTEAPSAAVNLDAEPWLSAATVGRPFDGVEIAIVDPDSGEALAAGERGEVAVRSPGASAGYVGERYGDRQTFRRDGVYPGDIGLIDDDGRLTLAGRTKLFIDVHGHKVDPLEVEDVLNQHPAVDEVVVVGSLDDRRGEPIVKAAVVAATPCSERELIHFCKERLALFKVPQVVEFRDEIPRSALGKVLRKELV